MKFLPLLFCFGQMKAYKPKTLTFNIEAIWYFILREVELKCQVWKGHVLGNLQGMTNFILG